MHRVEVEDVKGLEVVLLLAAAVIKDIFFNANREMFNIGSPTITPPKRNNSGPVINGGRTGRTGSSPPMMTGAVFTANVPARNNIPASQIPPPQPPRPQQQAEPRPPAADPRTQWEIDAETERLKKVVQQEEKARERADREEQKRIKKMLDAEEKERRRREADVEKETERLRKQYGVVGVQLPQQQQPSPYQQPQTRPQFPQSYSAPYSQPVPVQRPLSTPSGPPGVFNSPTVNSWLGGPQPPAQRPQQGPYLQAPGQGTASSSGFFGLGGKKVQKKRSVFF